MSELPSGTVTFLFTDIEGSTRLWQEHAEAMRSVLAHHDELVRSVIEDHGGYVVKTTGDGFHAAFGDPEAAVSAAVDAQRRLGSEAWPLPDVLRVRMGLHTGSVESRDGDYFGTAVNKAARLMSAAHGGQIVVSLATETLVQDSDIDLLDLGQHRLRDLTRTERVYQVVAPGLLPEFPPLRSLDAFPENLPPQLSSFVGRDDERAGLGKALGGSRLVTVIGVGGVGKTRLAIQVAADAIADYPDGAWFCELAAADDGDAMLQVMAGALGVQSRAGVGLDQSIVESLQARRVLVVLDNCEHLISEVAALASALLRECDDVSLLATSREALGIGGEQVWPLGSLDLPHVNDIERATTNESVRLFVDRASAARPGFELGAANLEAVVEICRRLDGIPLAIELAAARVVALSPADIQGLLDERFRLLAGGRRSSVERHQTLRATVDWSYALLDETERAVFDRMGVFAGSFDASAAQAVCVDERVEAWDVVDALGSLVAKSMIVVDEADDGSMRYQLLETLRQYALERLDETAQIDRWRARHAAHYADLIQVELDALNGPDEFTWRPRFLANFDNTRAALTWSLDRHDPDDVEYGVRIVAAIAASPEPTIAFADWVERAIPLVEGQSPELRAAILGAASVSLAHVGELDRAEALAHKALDGGLAVESRMAYGTLAITALHRGDRAEACRVTEACVDVLDNAEVSAVARVGAYALAAVFASVGGKQQAALGYAEQGLEIARSLRNPSTLALMLYGAGQAVEPHDPECALGYFEESAALVRLGAVHVSLGTNLAHLARLRDERGDLGVALGALDEALEYFRRIGPRADMAVVLAQMCRTFSRCDRLEPSAILAGIVTDGAVSIFAGEGTPARLSRASDRARVELGEDRYAACLARGAAMTYPEVMQFARDEIAAAIDAHSEIG